MGRHGVTTQLMKLLVYTHVRFNEVVILLTEHIGCDKEAKKLVDCMRDLWEANFRLTKTQDVCISLFMPVQTPGDISMIGLSTGLFQGARTFA